MILKVHLGFKIELKKEKLAIQLEETSLQDICHYLLVIKRTQLPSNLQTLNKCVTYYVK